MQFAAPTEYLSLEGQILTAGYDVDSIPTLQSGFLEDLGEAVLQSGVVGAEGQEIIEVDLIPSSGVYPMKEILMGEDIVSLRALFQKPGLTKENDTNTWFSGTTDQAFPHWGPTNYMSTAAYIDWYGTAFLGMAGSMRYKLLIDKDSIEYASAMTTKTPLRAVPMISYGGDAIGMSYPVSEMCPTITDQTLTAELTVPYYWHEKYIPAYNFGFSDRPLDYLNWEFGSNLKFQGMLYRSAGPDLRLTYFRTQNSFVFVPDPTYPVTDTWSTFRVGDTPPAALIAEKQEVEPSALVRKEVPLNLYMARTGRKERKEPATRVSYKQRGEQIPVPTSRVTQRDVVVAFVPPLRPASRRRVV